MKNRAPSFVRSHLRRSRGAPAANVVPTTALVTEFESAERVSYLKCLNDGMTIFDVGPNAGELTLLFSRSVGAGGKLL